MGWGERTSKLGLHSLAANLPLGAGVGDEDNEEERADDRGAANDRGGDLPRAGHVLAVLDDMVHVDAGHGARRKECHQREEDGLWGERCEVTQRAV